MNAPSARHDFGNLGQLASSPSSANAMTGDPSLASVFTAQHTPTQPTFPRTYSINNQGLLAQPAQRYGSHGSDSATSWTFPEYLQPSTLIPDGEPFPHLPPPFASSGLDQLRSHLASPQSSTPAASRKKDQACDEPQSLEELRDPPSGQKPDYPYPTLIRCAILSHSKRTPTLSEIYNMIHQRFPYFKMDDMGWKNSVRHHLSISPSFVKIPRHITEPGKGNYWAYTSNPPNRVNRRSKRKPDRDDELYHDADSETRSSQPPAPVATLVFECEISLVAPESGVLRPGRNVQLIARDNNLGGPAPNHENLPLAKALFVVIGQISSVAEGDDGFNMPLSPYASGTSSGPAGGSGIRGNGALDFGALPVFPGRGQSRYRSGSQMPFAPQSRRVTILVEQHGASREPLRRKAFPHEHVLWH